MNDLRSLAAGLLILGAVVARASAGKDVWLKDLKAPIIGGTDGALYAFPLGEESRK